MEEEKQNEFSSCCPPQKGSSSSTPDVLAAENQGDSLTSYTPHPGTVIPNRIFVGGIDDKVRACDLLHLFSPHGAVKEVKLQINRFGMTKGYGFVTFESQEDVLKILHDTKRVCLKGKKLCIAQAVRKSRASGPPKRTTPCFAMPMSCDSEYLNTSAGFPYTYNNGVAYFHHPYCPNISPPAPQWPVSKHSYLGLGIV
ncbi:hypothetical protein CgunFtcFv8_018442 [Champsocephalus gunnari]|uniref:RRM domain-containing protein n=1 Tax=Champsocephalus gunnari TaxID=52237 RepID=A0AAN8BTF0_CHAGU|nr:hypothetical protein CgunFtcFv8_018442 [Champsocephalus gunnari]